MESFPDTSSPYNLLQVKFMKLMVSYNTCVVSRFDLLANGGASLTLSYERSPFPTLYRTVWLPWNVFHVMDTVVMKREENDIPSCYLTGLVRPNPLILATPLSTLYKTSPEDSPIIPETQVRLLSKWWLGGVALQGFYCNSAHIWLCAIIWPMFEPNCTGSIIILFSFHCVFSCLFYTESD